MTYKDCLYYPVCHFYTNDCVNKCGHFKNKSDFAEVVRCKDCKYWDTLYKRCIFGRIFNELGFCNYGERK